MQMDGSDASISVACGKRWLSTKLRKLYAAGREVEGDEEKEEGKEEE